MGVQPLRRRILAAMAAAPMGIALARPRDGAPLLACLSGGETVEQVAKLMAPFGYVAGRNLRIVVRTAKSLPDLPAAAVELVALAPDVLLADGPAVMALAGATRTIPIVCAGLPDPVGAGLAQSLRRPGGNVTGLATGSPETAEIVFALLKAMRPRLRRIAVLHSPGAPVAIQMRAHGEVARAAGLEWILAPISTPAEAERALAPLAGEAAWMAPIDGHELWKEARDIAHRHRIATHGGYPGTLMSYGRTFTDHDRSVGAVVDKILRGANPAEIPFELPDRLSFVVNRATARAIGIEVPGDILLRATKVID